MEAPEAIDISSSDDEEEDDFTGLVSSTQDAFQGRLASSELYGVLNSKVVGVQYYRGLASAGECVDLVREAHNQYDSNAIRVDNVQRQQIGHVPRTMAAKLAKYIDSGSLLVEGSLASGMGTYDCALSIMLYGPSDPIDRQRIKEDMKRDRLPTQIAQQRERESKKRQAAELKAAAKRTKFNSRENALVQGDVHGNGIYSQSLDDIVDGAQRFDPRHLDQAVEHYGVDEDALAAMPLIDAPPELSTRMLNYQRQALAWLLEKESPRLPAEGCTETVQLWKRMPHKNNYWTNIATNFSIANQQPKLASGGILSDDMGLGKTLEMISLILTSRGPTLIVAPVGLMSNWSGQIQQHIRHDDALRVYIHHGTARKTMKPAGFLEYDVVITSYGTLTTEHYPEAKTGLHSVPWRRVILDEGHTIRNPQTKAAVAATALQAQSKWVLTGTPVINSLVDLYSLVRFVGLGGGLEQLKVFNSVLIRPLKQGDSNAGLLLQALMANICLRRRKEMKFVNLGLPPLNEYVHRVEFSAHEQEKYSALQNEAKGLLQSVQGGKSQEYCHLLEVLLRLRQICNHWQLCGDRVSKVLAMLETNGTVELTPEARNGLQSLLQLSIDQREDCPICLENLHSPIITTCAHIFGRSCIERIVGMQHKCPMCRARLEMEHLVPPAMEKRGEAAEGNSAKTDALVQIVMASLKKDSTTKTVIFSQWTSFLTILEPRLGELGYARIDGSMTPSQRDTSMQRFQHDPQCAVMLASLAVCSVGLSLVAANQVILADSWWAPAIEDQAVDRVHRLGQTRPTTVWRIVVEGTVEESVLEVQAEKRKLMSVAFAEKTSPRRGGTSRLHDIERLLS